MPRAYPIHQPPSRPFPEPTASLTINNGTPATGHIELAATAASYMEAFPDLQVSVDHLHVAGDSAFWVWTLTGTNNGPGGTGKKARVASSGWHLDLCERQRHVLKELDQRIQPVFEAIRKRCAALEN